MNDTIKYAGNVKLSKKTPNGNVIELQVKNNGTKKLFKGLCFALLGHPFDLYKPTWITIANRTNGETYTDLFTGTSILSSYSFVNGSLEKVNNDGDYKAVLRGTISAYQINSGIAQDNQNLYICLLDNEDVETLGENVLAFIKMEEPIVLTAGTVLTIEWSMNFSNKEAN